MYVRGSGRTSGAIAVRSPPLWWGSPPGLPGTGGGRPRLEPGDNNNDNNKSLSLSLSLAMYIHMYDI